MDPLSLSIGVIAIIQVTSQTALQLYTFVDSIRNAPTEIGVLSREAHSFYGVLRGLAVALESPQIKDYVRRNAELREHLQSLEEPIRLCDRRVGELLVKLESVTERKADGARTMRLKWYLTRNDVLEARTYLADTTRTVNLALNSITLAENLRHNAGSGEPAQVAPDNPKSSNSLESQLQALQKQGVDLRRAARDGDIRVIELLLQAGVPVDSKGYKDRTALSQAAENGNVETVRLLLEGGAYVDSQSAVIKGNYRADTESRRTPLHWAAAGGHQKVVELLVAAGARLELKTESQRTPAQEAATAGHYKTLTFLLDKGADVNTKTYYGWTALHTAVVQGELELAILLLERGANVEAVYRGKWQGDVKGEISASSQRPLHYAAHPKKRPSGDATAMIELLIHKGNADAMAVDSSGATPMHYAARVKWKEGAEAIFKLTCEHTLTVKDAAGATPIDIAQDAGDTDLAFWMRSWLEK